MNIKFLLSTMFLFLLTPVLFAQTINNINPPSGGSQQTIIINNGNTASLAGVQSPTSIAPVFSKLDLTVGLGGTFNLANLDNILLYYSAFVDVGYRFNQLVSAGLELRHNGTFQELTSQSRSRAIYHLVNTWSGLAISRQSIREDIAYGLYFAEMILAPYVKLSFVRNIFELNLSTGVLIGTGGFYKTKTTTKSSGFLDSQTQQTDYHMSGNYKTNLIANARLTLFFTYIEYSAVIDFRLLSANVSAMKEAGISQLNRLGFGLAFTF